MKSATLTAAMAVALVLSGGCGGSLPPTHYYVLEPQDVNAASLPGGLNVGVDRFDVDPPYDQDRIVYRVGDESAEVGFYAYHRWAAPLERMLPRFVASAYADVPGLHSIEPVAPGRDYDAYLRGRVAAIEEIDTPEGQRVRIRLDLRLVIDDRDVWAARIRETSDVTANDVADIVERIRSAIDEGLQGTIPELQVVLTRHGS